MRLYVASSWRNDLQPHVVKALRDGGHEVYDFRNPGNGSRGFAWAEIDQNWRTWSMREQVGALVHPLARRAWLSDFRAMKWAEGCVLVSPCGRSAHLEAGYFVGAGK